tara:strand:+ start:1193 stop:1777 length:585 start_codon:yes stop_codon:yes gene_type:complete
LIKFKNFIFSNRSYTPIPILIIIIYFSSFILKYFFVGLFLICFGEFIRINAVRYAGGVTRTTTIGAPILIKDGPYSISRNPLYFGNMIIYCGVVIMAGGTHIWELLILTFIYFSVQYLLIISLEEETLTKLFKTDYLNYCSKVPRLFPKKLFWINDFKKQKSLIKTLKTEKRTLQNIFITISIVLYKSFYLNIY